MEPGSLTETRFKTECRKGRVVMWQQCLAHIREHPLSWVLVVCVIAAVIYVFVHREQLFHLE